MTMRHRAVFLLDVDNTLFDNDALEHDLRSYLERELGAGAAQRYWEIFEQLRSQLSYVDFLGSVQKLRQERQNDPRVLQLPAFLLDYPFASRVYPGVHAALQHLNTLGLTVVLSDGDGVFQPHKVRRSGLSEMVAGRVLIYIHKEQMIEEIERLYPAQHYFMIDDKLRVLAAMKRALGGRVTTIFPRQGHYAFDPKIVAEYSPADITV